MFTDSNWTNCAILRKISRPHEWFIKQIVPEKCHGSSGGEIECIQESIATLMSDRRWNYFHLASARQITPIKPGSGSGSPVRLPAKDLQKIHFRIALKVIQSRKVAMATSPCQSHRHRGHTHRFFLLSDLIMKTTSYNCQIYHISYVHIHTLGYKIIYIPVRNKIKKTNLCKTWCDLQGLYA